jgi:endoglucanase
MLRLDIPESGGAIPDVLAEIKWNLDWMLKMQDADDGGVWHKATSANFCGFVMPEDDRDPVLIIGSGREPYRTTEATADFAAVCAIAARVYHPFDAPYADRCRAAAERAWTWAVGHPEAHFAHNPEGIRTGGYGDKDANDELLWAAAELFRTTGKPEYNDYFVAHFAKWNPTLSADAVQGWPNVQNLGMYAYALCATDADRAGAGDAKPNAEVVAKIKSDAVAAADGIVARSQRNAYRIALRSKDYYWGSNSVVANYATLVLLANRFSPKPEYTSCAQDALHYLLGRNTFDTSFVTQLGSRWPMHPHHRPSAADGIEQPWPGMLVGRARTPTANRRLRGNGPTTRRASPTNEIAINWNAPLVFLLADALPAPRPAAK